MLDKKKVSCIFKIQILSFMTPTLLAHILGDCIFLPKYAQKGKGPLNIKCIFKHMPKMSGYPNKSVFMLQIKGGMKKQNCFYLGTLTFFAYA